MGYPSWDCPSQMEEEYCGTVSVLVPWTKIMRWGMPQALLLQDALSVSRG